MTTKRAKLSQVQIASYIMLTAGLFVVAFSFFSNSSIGALIGLGLTFWGALLLYIKPGHSNGKILIEAAISPSFEMLGQLIQELGYKGDITYLPPRYLTNPENTKICITKDKYGDLPTPEQTRLCKNKPVSLTSQALFLTPSGIKLSRMLEKTMGKNFNEMNLESLQQRLSDISTEDLEIAEKVELQTIENLEIQTTSDITEDLTWHKLDRSNVSYCNKCGTQLDLNAQFCRACGTRVAPLAEAHKRLPPETSPTARRNAAIHARITRPANGLAFRENLSIDCPICSAIAIAITKATGKPIRIADIVTSEDGNVVEADYVIIEE